LAWLSIEARKLLDAAGFHEAKIFASNDLDERLIQSLKAQEAPIDVWGVGTKLVTAYEQPALGGVYKLGAIRQNGEWMPRIKLSEQRIKISNPGIQQVRRFVRNGMFVADAIFDTELGAGTPCEIIDPLDPDHSKRIADAECEDLLVPILRNGDSVYNRPTLNETRARTLNQLARLPASCRRLDNPHVYPVGLERALHQRKESIILAARGKAPQEVL
jgi:nicotinate phosphoribosyltransferase